MASEDLPRRYVRHLHTDNAAYRCRTGTGNGPVLQTVCNRFHQKKLYQEGDSPAPGRTGQRAVQPSVTGGSVDSVNLMWIRTDWLEKLNLESTRLWMSDEHDESVVNADFDGSGQKIL